MTHGIHSSEEGKHSFAHVNQSAWHGLGQQLTAGAPLEVWKEEAGLDWTIQTSDILYTVEDRKKILKMPERKLFYRSDDHSALAVVSSKFKVVQPGDTIEFYSDLVGSAGFQLETAGCLFGGRKFWALARCGEGAKIMGEDAIEPFLLLASSCDGSMATAAHLTSVRVVCNNTLRMAIGSEGKRAQIRIPHNAEFNAEQVKRDIGIARNSWDAFISNINKLAKHKISRDNAIDLVASQLKSEWTNEHNTRMNSEEMLEASLSLRNIIRLYDGDAMGAEMKSSNGTAWGLLNAVTEYYDHEAGAKSGDRSRAFERAHLTDHAKLKVSVANELLKEVV